ncbi:ABC transporter substrate-binding protein [Kribbella qitaiheensis]|uniref:ABC transporter substrate-binding protein n=1 Tax=Kribbella qitaiheensis TaxID=1544730 RepID=UPI0016281DEB|nr:ABC transporter substrate-binding protein [Kribbella qitaiheensis]
MWLVVAATVAVAGCGSDSSEAEGSGGPTKLTVGVGAGPFVAPLETAQFSDAGFDVTRQNVTSGSVAVPLVLNGQLKFSQADAVGALTAISKGVPLVFVGSVTSTGATADQDSTAILVKPGSGLKAAADLKGKKVGVNGIGGAAQLAAAAAIDKLGGDSTKVEFVEMPPNSLTGAVADGTLAAAVTSRSEGQAEGLDPIIAPTAEAMPSAPLIVWVTSKQYAEKNPEVVERFAAAAEKANDELAHDPERVRKIVVEKATAKISPELAKTMALPQFAPTTIQRDRLQTVVDLMVQYKVIPKPIDLDTVLVAS